MIRLTSHKTRKLLEENLVREIAHETIEAPAIIRKLSDCESVVESFTQGDLKNSDYFRIGSFMNLESSQRSYCQISVFYYEKVGGEIK